MKTFAEKTYCDHLRDMKAIKKQVWVYLNAMDFPNHPKGERLRLFRGQNKELFRLLDESLFFQFHITNAGKSVLIYQIIKFFSERNGGWKVVLEGEVAQKGQIEIHHYDHDVQNNSPENLEYVTPEMNKLATEFTEKFIKSDKPAQIIREIKNRFDGQILIILGKVVRIVDVILKTVKLSKSVGLDKIGSSPYGGFSAKQMLANFKKFGFTSLRSAH